MLGGFGLGYAVSHDVCGLVGWGKRINLLEVWCGVV